MKFESFVNPPAKLRPAPFWAINDEITPEETARQMADMIDKGLSGGFFHSRAGLITPYMGDRWFECMEAALKVAEGKDGYLWLYDEDLWPSGNAGGQVAALGDQYRKYYLEPEYVAAGELPRDEPEGEPKAAYAVLRREGMRADEIRGIDFGVAWQWTGVERLLLRKYYSPKTGWWSGESYCNLLNPDVTRKFIELTHEVYFRRLGKHFGKRVPGIFTDEPQVNAGLDCLFWYDGLPDVYREMTGRNLWADLPYLWLNGPEARKIRLLFHRTALAQFCRAYSRPIYEWCEKHGIAHTGHYNAEETFLSQITNHGGSIMAHYRYQQMPGIDHLCRNTDGMLLTVKQCASAARQLGRGPVLTEIFGVSHHTNTFEDFKWLGDYDMALGATFFCPHLTWYSMRGKRKRDYPPNWNYQQTYWAHLKPLNDYFTRLAAVLNAGRPVVDILVLHSIGAATAALRRGLVIGKRNVPNRIAGPDVSEVNRLDSQMRSAVQAICDAGYDCDLGDEDYLADYGGVEGGRFRVGEMAYSVVVVPEAPTWRPGTLALLEKFADAGGTVILLGRLPEELDCEPAADRWAAFASRKNVLTVPSSARELQCALDACVKSPWRLRDRDGMPVRDTYVQYRADGGTEFLFVANSSRQSGREYRLTLFGAAGKPLAVWDPLTGGRTAVEARRAGGDLAYEFDLPPCGSLLLAIGEGAIGSAGAAGVAGDVRAAVAGRGAGAGKVSAKGKGGAGGGRRGRSSGKSAPPDPREGRRDRPAAGQMEVRAYRGERPGPRQDRLLPGRREDILRRGHGLPRQAADRRAFRHARGALLAALGCRQEGAVRRQGRRGHAALPLPELADEGSEGGRGHRGSAQGQAFGQRNAG
ncbi:MAG: hypothetical protein N3A38_01405 [Planctomycetota bacterium]|nr:hypothetical protein [Planctomycetota bacterium]